MSALVKNMTISNDSNSVTKISAHARIDYILRFSKQAIVVIDESVAQTSAFSGQFLASLPEQHNAAYISLSAQFTDIQIRCRIIEQLYTNELFDPEISLAVSVINFAKKSPQSISIVLDNVQHLSLQIFHELSQLAAIAKQADLMINIVMFGSVQAGQTVANNKSLFDNKLTLLSAQSGQLLSPSATIFKNTRPKWHFIQQNKWLLSTLLILLALAAVVIVLLRQGSFNFYQPVATSQQEKISLTAVLAQPQTMVLAAKGEVIAETAVDKSLDVAHNIAAIPEDIYTSLINPSTENLATAPMIIATSADIFSAMSNENNIKRTVEDVKLDDTADKKDARLTARPRALGNQLTVNNDYYINKSGYVIQIAAFGELNLPISFLATLSTGDYQAYQRLLNNKPVIVITSIIYKEKSAAQSALSALPEALLSRQPWIKSVAVINNEINAFIHSQ